MPKKVQPAAHRIIKKDTPASIAKHKKAVADSDREKDELIQHGRKLMAPVIAYRKKLAAIAKDLRIERERQGLSLADIEGRTGMDRVSIHRLEVGKSVNPTIGTLDRYAVSLGLDLQLTLKR